MATYRLCDVIMYFTFFFVSCRLLAAFALCYFQSSVLSGATIDDDPEAECRRCCAFNFPVSDLTYNVNFQ